VSDLRNKIAKEIVRWQIANGEEFLPNSLADRIVAILPRADAVSELQGDSAALREAFTAGVEWVLMEKSGAATKRQALLRYPGEPQEGKE